MDAIRDFEDMLELLEQHDARYLIVGGLACIFHARPRYTKDMDLWIDPTPANVARANAALAEFGSPFTLDPNRTSEIVQVGMPPNRIDFLLEVEGAEFGEVWKKRIRSTYGRAPANYIDIDSLILVKGLIDSPRHQDDVKALEEAKRLLLEMKLKRKKSGRRGES